MDLKLDSPCTQIPISSPTFLSTGYQLCILYQNHLQQLPIFLKKGKKRKKKRKRTTRFIDYLPTLHLISHRKAMTKAGLEQTSAGHSLTSKPSLLFLQSSSITEHWNDSIHSFQWYNFQFPCTKQRSGTCKHWQMMIKSSLWYLLEKLKHFLNLPF